MRVKPEVKRTRNEHLQIRLDVVCFLYSIVRKKDLSGFWITFVHNCGRGLVVKPETSIFLTIHDGFAADAGRSLRKSMYKDHSWQVSLDARLGSRSWFHLWRNDTAIPLRLVKNEEAEIATLFWEAAVIAEALGSRRDLDFIVVTFN